MCLVFHSALHLQSCPCSCRSESHCSEKHAVSCTCILCLSDGPMGWCFSLAPSQCSVSMDVAYSPEACISFLVDTVGCGTSLFHVCSELPKCFLLWNYQFEFHCYSSDVVGLVPMVSLLRLGGTLQRCSLHGVWREFRIFRTSLKETSTTIPSSSSLFSGL